MDRLFCVFYSCLSCKVSLFTSHFQYTELDRAPWAVPAPPQLAVFQTSIAQSRAAQHTFSSDHSVWLELMKVYETLHHLLRASR